MKQAVLFSRRIALFALVAVCVAGCSTTTSISNSDPHLRPQRVSGEYVRIFDLAKKVAIRIFPDGSMSENASEGLITVTRINFLRGNTQIKITFEKQLDGAYLVHCASAGYGSNPPMVDFSTGQEIYEGI